MDTLSVVEAVGVAVFEMLTVTDGVADRVLSADELAVALVDGLSVADTEYVGEKLSVAEVDELLLVDGLVLTLLLPLAENVELQLVDASVEGEKLAELLVEAVIVSVATPLGERDKLGVPLSDGAEEPNSLPLVLSVCDTLVVVYGEAEVLPLLLLLPESFELALIELLVLSDRVTLTETETDAVVLSLTDIVVLRLAL